MTQKAAKTGSGPTAIIAIEQHFPEGARIITPYLWWGFPTYQIRDTPFETAMSQFVFDHRDDSYNEMARHEVSPMMNDLLWSMSEANDLESSNDVTNVNVTNQRLSAIVHAKHKPSSPSSPCRATPS